MRSPEKPFPADEPQADPQSQRPSGHRASPLQMTIVAIACAFIVGLTIYGLGRPAPNDGDIMASAPPAQETTGAAPAKTEAAPPEQPAQQSVPEQPAQQPMPEQTAQ